MTANTEISIMTIRVYAVQHCRSHFFLLLFSLSAFRSICMTKLSCLLHICLKLCVQPVALNMEVRLVWNARHLHRNRNFLIFVGISSKWLPPFSMLCVKNSRCHLDMFISFILFIFAVNMSLLFLCEVNERRMMWTMCMEIGWVYFFSCQWSVWMVINYRIYGDRKIEMLYTLCQQNEISKKSDRMKKPKIKINSVSLADEHSVLFVIFIFLLLQICLLLFYEKKFFQKKKLGKM